MKPASESIRELGDLAADLVSRVPADPDRKSPRWLELKTLRSAHGVGRGRAELLNGIGVDVGLMAGYDVLLLGGVADCFFAAEARDDAVNRPALSAAVRPVVEVAAQVAWLLDDQADPVERVRRYLRWRFADLKSQRLLLAALSASKENAAEAREALDRTEATLIGHTERAGWKAVRTKHTGPRSLEAASLLDEQGNRMGVPKIEVMARRVSQSPYVYALLSAPVHGARWGVVNGVRRSGGAGDAISGSVDIVGTALQPNLAMGLSVLAIDTVGKYIAAWNRVDGERLRRETQTLCARAGIR